MTDSAPDDAFLAAFETQAIPLAEWSHRCHVRMAYLYLRAHGYDAGLRRIRDGIYALGPHWGQSDAHVTSTRQASL